MASDMPQFKVSAEKEAELAAWMESLGIREADLCEKFIRGGGPGGQKINKTSSCVYLRHEPTGLEVKCQASRSQSLNRFMARRELCERLAVSLKAEKTKKQQAVEKIRRQKRRRTRRSKEKMLADKRVRKDIKSGRRRVSDD